jgi:hypothetical protein
MSMPHLKFLPDTYFLVLGRRPPVPLQAGDQFLVEVDFSMPMSVVGGAYEWSEEFVQKAGHPRQLVILYPIGELDEEYDALRHVVEHVPTGEQVELLFSYGTDYGIWAILTDQDEEQSFSFEIGDYIKIPLVVKEVLEVAPSRSIAHLEPLGDEIDGRILTAVDVVRSHK